MRFVLILISLAFLVPDIGRGEPTTGSAKVKSIRVYNNQGAAGVAFVQLDQTTLCGTDTYSVDLSWGGGREILATALSAFHAGASLQVEIVNTGCTGWATRIQSITLVK